MPYMRHSAVASIKRPPKAANKHRERRGTVEKRYRNPIDVSAQAATLHTSFAYASDCKTASISQRLDLEWEGTVCRSACWPAPAQLGRLAPRPGHSQRPALLNPRLLVLSLLLRASSHGSHLQSVGGGSGTELVELSSLLGQRLTLSDEAHSGR